jgi:septal ring factor EnvC (AmiA/AmiB activator)
VNYSARRYNDLKIGNEMLTKQLKRSLDELDEQKLIFENLDAMTKAETDDSGRIESLKKEIDQVEVDISRKVHYSRQLEHMLQRLVKNQLKFDAHMVGMEQSMHAITKEASEIRLLRKGLDVGLAKAVNVLEETKSK